MTLFLLQSAFLLVLCFLGGYYLARFARRGICRLATLWSKAAGRRNEFRNAPGLVTPRVMGIGSDTRFDSGILSNRLQIIEGIGPKTESILNVNGIITWSDLATKSVPELRHIFKSYGRPYQTLDPTSWLEQSRLAARGEVNELIALQKKEGLSKLESMLYQRDGDEFSRYQRDDLKVVEGIGPKIEVLLKNSGIDNWQVLAESRLPEIRAILRAAGPGFSLAAPESWALQARLAEKGRWGQLRLIQRKLRGARPGRISHETALAV